MSDFENQMNRMFGGNKANYSVEDIEAAKKRQKKYGGTLYENLSAITMEKRGQKPLSPIMGSAFADNASAAQKDIVEIENAVR